MLWGGKKKKGNVSHLSVLWFLEGVGVLGFYPWEKTTALELITTPRAGPLPFPCPRPLSVWAPRAWWGRLDSGPGCWTCPPRPSPWSVRALCDLCPPRLATWWTPRTRGEAGEVKRWRENAAVRRQTQRSQASLIYCYDTTKLCDHLICARASRLQNAWTWF